MRSALSLLTAILISICFLDCNDPTGVSDANITIFLSDTTITAGDTLMFNGDGISGLLQGVKYTYNWTASPDAYLSSPDGKSVYFCADTAGKYKIILSVSGAGSESASGVAIVTVNPKPPMVAAINLNDSTLSYNNLLYINSILCRHDTLIITHYDTMYDTIYLHDTNAVACTVTVWDTVFKCSSAGNIGSDSLVQYHWVALDSELIITNHDDSIALISVAHEGTFGLRLIVSDARETRDSTTVYLKVSLPTVPEQPAPKILGSDTVIYCNDTVILHFDSIPGSESQKYIWHVSDSSIVLDSSGSALILRSRTAGPVSVNLAYVRDSDTLWGTGIVISVIGRAQAVIESDSLRTIETGKKVTLDASKSITGRTTSPQIVWCFSENGGRSNDTGLTTEFTAQNTGIYRIIAEINDGVRVGIPDTVWVFASRPGDTTVPLNISNLHCTPHTGSSVSLTWTKSLSTDAYMIQFRQSVDSAYPLDIHQGTASVTVSSTESSCVIGNLEQKKILRFSAFVLDSSGRWSLYSVSAQCSTLISDTIAPSSVEDVYAAIGPDDSIELHWRPSASDDIATIIAVLRTDRYPGDTADGEMLLRGSHGDTTLKIMRPVNTTSVFFAVYAIDTSGWCSPGAFTALTYHSDTETTHPAPPAMTGFHAEALGMSRIRFSWSRYETPDSGVIVIRYRTDDVFPAYCSDGMPVVELSTADSTYIWTECKQLVPYSFSIFIRNTEGSCSDSGNGNSDTLMLPDTVAPENVIGLTGQFDKQTHQIILHWSASPSEDADSIMICLRTDGTFPTNCDDNRIITLPNTDSTISIPADLSHPGYYITTFVQDTNVNLNHSGQSVMVSIQSDALQSDTIRPTGPLNFLVTNSSDSTAIEFSWTRPESDDADSIFVRYAINSPAPKSPAEGIPAFADTVPRVPSLTVQKSLSVYHEKAYYAFSAFIKDLAGNWSTATSDTVFTFDRTRPENIRSLKCTLISQSSIRIEWQSSLSDDRDSLRLCIRTDRFSADPEDCIICRSRTCDMGNSDTLNGLNEKCVYFITAFICDSAHNWSFSDAASQDSIRTGDHTAPQPLNHFEALPIDNNRILVQWDRYTGSSDADSIIITVSAGSNIPGIGGSVCARIPIASSQDTIRGLFEKYRYTFSAFVRDSSGNCSSGASDSATTSDLTKPFNIAGFTVNDAGNNTASLSWQPSVSPDADSIILCRQTGGYSSAPSGESVIARISAGISSYQSINLSEKTRYWFSAFVKDYSGNISDFSSWAADTVTIKDRTPPHGISDFSASGAHDGTIRFNWSTEPTWVDAESIRVVIRNDHYPADPEDGSIILRTTSTATADSVSTLEGKQIYFCRAFVMDTSKNFDMNSTPDTAWVPDWTAPQNVTDMVTIPEEEPSTTVITWTRSSSADAESTVIIAKTDGSYPSSSSDGTAIARIATGTTNTRVDNLLLGIEYRFAAFVKDSAGLWSIPSPTARVRLNRSPFAKAGRDTSIFLLNGNSLILDGGGSFDPDGNILSYHWQASETNPAVVAITQTRNPELTFVQPGNYVFILTVDDGSNNSAPDQIIVTYMAPRYIVSGSMQPGNGYTLYRTIQAAIDASHSGDTIVVDNGAYPENIECYMKTDLTIMGMSRSGVIVDGNAHSPFGSTLRIDSASNGITIKNMTFKNGGRNDPANIDVAGITCIHAQNVILENDSVVTNYGDGIRMFMSSSISIVGCAVAYNAYSGVKGTSSSFTMEASEIFNNCTSDSPDAWGVFLDCETDLAQTVTIHGNEFRNAGITQISINDTRFNGSQYNIAITGNIFTSGMNGIICTGNPAISPDPSTNNVFSGITGEIANCR